LGRSNSSNKGTAFAAHVVQRIILVVGKHRATAAAAGGGGGGLTV
jgi:hypothetical protein